MNNVIKKYIRSKTARPVVVEVGAHYGEDTTAMLEILDPLRMYCFEPDPRNIAVFNECINDDRVTLFQYAVSNGDESQINFYQAYDPNVTRKTLSKYGWINQKEYINQKLNASGASSLKTGHPLVKDANIIKVETVRIDTWAAKHNVDNIDFMWVDVQGAESEVIDGFGRMADKIRYIWIECGEVKYVGGMSRRRTIQLMASYHFSLVKKISSKKAKGNLLFLKDPL